MWHACRLEQMLAVPDLLAIMGMTLESDAERDHVEQAAGHFGPCSDGSDQRAEGMIDDWTA